jgi:hypothetical protein
MNIFYLHPHPKICAIYHNNRHNIKMCLETAQLLYTCLHLISPELLETAPFNKSGTQRGYKPSHKNHPSAIWTRHSIHNYKWLCQLGIELCKEYTFRYNKIHSCEKHLVWLSRQNPPLPDIPFTQPTPAMPDMYKHEDSIIAYRQYYKGEKASFCQWTKRNIPHWFSS